MVPSTQIAVIKAYAAVEAATKCCENPYSFTLVALAMRGSFAWGGSAGCSVAYAPARSGVTVTTGGGVACFLLKRRMYVALLGARRQGIRQSARPERMAEQSPRTNL